MEFNRKKWLPLKKHLIAIAFILISNSSFGQTIVSASPLLATGGDYFSMTVVMSGTASNPYNIKLVSPSNTISPWSAYNSTGNTYIVDYLLRDYEKIGDYALTYNTSTYPNKVRINRPMVPEKFTYQRVTSPNIPVNTGEDDGISYMVTDSHGNLYCVGTFTGTMSISGQSLTASGFRDGYVMKYDSSGTVVWMRKVGSAIDNNIGIYEGLRSIRIHGDSVLSVAGYMRCDTSLKFNGSTPLQYPSRNIGTQDGMVMKLDSAGNLQWTTFQGSLKQDATYDLEFDQSGGLFVTGYAQSEDFSSSGLNDTSFTYVYNANNTDSVALGAYANDQYGFFVVHYSPTGQIIWAKRQTRDYFVSGSFPVRIKMGQDHNLVILTIGGGQLKWNGSPCSNGTCCNVHYALIKMDTLGNKLWCLEDGNFVKDMDMGLDANNNIYVLTPTSWIGGDSETFLRKYSPTGTLLWSKFIQRNKSNMGNYAMATDSSGNSYISHAYEHLWANSNKVIVTKKFNANGDLLSVGYPEPYTTNLENKPTAIALSPNEDKIYQAGHYKGTQKFGSFNLVGTTRKPFLLKSSMCPVSYDSIAVTSCGPYLTPSGNQLLSTSGFYADTLINSAGCDSIILISLQVYSNPVVNILASGPISFCRGDSVLLNATPGMATYQWYKGINPVPGANAGSLNVKTAGSYYCLATNAGQCPDTSNTIRITIPCIPREVAALKIEDTFNSNEIQISPNPSAGIFQLNAPSGILHIFNSNGALVFKSAWNETDDLLDLSNLPSGIYSITLQSNDLLNRKTISIVK